MERRNGVMYNLDVLKGHFQESTLNKLAEIFDKANHMESANTSLRELNSDLLRVLQQEKCSDSYLCYWEISPSANQHIIATQSLCLLINVYGFHVLFENWLFYEGELSLEDFHWIEDDHLVVFNVHYIVHGELEKCICHFNQTDFFVYFSPIHNKTIPDFLL